MTIDKYGDMLTPTEGADEDTFTGWVGKYGEWTGNYVLAANCFEWDDSIFDGPRNMVWWQYDRARGNAVGKLVDLIEIAGEGLQAVVKLDPGVALGGCRFGLQGLTTAYRVQTGPGGVMVCVAERIKVTAVGMIPLEAGS